MAKKDEAKKTFAVLKNLRHDGKHYNPSDTVEMTDAEAKPLLAAKVVEAAK